jgi:hypothetical protein
VDVRLGVRGVDAQAAAAEDGSLLDRRAPRHERLRELEQGDRVAVGRLDRHRSPALRQRAHEGDDAGRRRADLAVGRHPDVDAAVLPAGIRIRADRERAEYRTVDRPGPAERSRCRCERHEHDRRRKDSSHERLRVQE